MSLSLSKERKAEVIFSIRRFFSEELELVLSELQSGFLLDYFRLQSGCSRCPEVFGPFV
jgi:uncharacterized protein (DUF2164 family)